MRRIEVFWWRGKEKVRIGELGQGRSPKIMFEWDKLFLNDPTELSPIRFKKTPGILECPAEPFEGLPGLIADHVPDGWGRILMRHGFERKGLSLDQISPLDMLSYIGNRGMGALSFKPSNHQNEVWVDKKLDLDSLSEGALQIMSGTPSEVIEQFLQAGSSPNGIRPKLVANERNGKFFIGNNELEADQWLIKFRAPSDSPEIGKVEYIYSEMARASGLGIPASKLISTKNGDYFAVKRFDRNNGKRVHMHTLSGLLHTSPSNFSVSYEHFAKVSNALTRDIRELEKVYRIATFNILACNRDDHSKNVAFLMSSSGKWQVAPAYDLTFFEGQFGQHKMSLNNKGLPTEKDLVEFAINFGLQASKAREIIEQTKESLSRFKALAKKYKVAPFERKRIGNALDKILRSNIKG
jgi:serine/threonine-protein kinase HipA